MKDTDLLSPRAGLSALYIEFTLSGQYVSTGLKESRNHQSDGSQVLRASSAGTR